MILIVRKELYWSHILLKERENFLIYARERIRKSTLKDILEKEV